MASGKDRRDFFQEGCSFYSKNKLKSEIFNDKKGSKTKMFLSFPTKNLNWEILTKNLVTFKKYPNAHYELGNNFNCDFNLLMPMSLLLISNKKKYYLAIDWLGLIITFDVVRR